MASGFDSSNLFLGAGHTAGLPEREQIIGTNNRMYCTRAENYQDFFSGFLERGTVVTKFYAKQKPERKTMLIRRETMLKRGAGRQNREEHT